MGNYFEFDDKEIVAFLFQLMERSSNEIEKNN